MLYQFLPRLPAIFCEQQHALIQMPVSRGASTRNPANLIRQKTDALQWTIHGTGDELPGAATILGFANHPPVTHGPAGIFTQKLNGMQIRIVQQRRTCRRGSCVSRQGRQIQTAAQQEEQSPQQTVHGEFFILSGLKQHRTSLFE